jgi:hypothetical protein
VFFDLFCNGNNAFFRGDVSFKSAVVPGQSKFLKNPVSRFTLQLSHRTPFPVPTVQRLPLRYHRLVKQSHRPLRHSIQDPKPRQIWNGTLQPQNYLCNHQSDPATSSSHKGHPPLDTEQIRQRQGRHLPYGARGRILQRLGTSKCNTVLAHDLRSFPPMKCPVVVLRPVDHDTTLFAQVRPAEFQGLLMLPCIAHYYCVQWIERIL